MSVNTQDNRKTYHGVIELKKRIKYRRKTSQLTKPLEFCNRWFQ